MTGNDGNPPRGISNILDTIKNVLGHEPERLNLEKRTKSVLFQVKTEKDFLIAKKINKLISGQAVNVVEHPTANSCRAVLVEHELNNETDDQLKVQLEAAGVKTFKRLTRTINGNTVPNGVIILTFHGTKAPTHITYRCHLRLALRPFYPSPMQCYGCWEFGHLNNNCKKESRCGNCAEKTHVNRDINEKCTDLAKCTRCGTNEHGLGSKKCPQYIKEVQITKMRVDKNLPYYQAKSEWEKAHGAESYSNVSQKQITGTETPSVMEILTKICNFMENSRQPQNTNDKTENDNEWKTEFLERQNKLESSVASLNRNVSKLSAENDLLKQTNATLINQMNEKDKIIKQLNEKIGRMSGRVTPSSGRSTPCSSKRSLDLDSASEPAQKNRAIMMNEYEDSNDSNTETGEYISDSDPNNYKEPKMFTETLQKDPSNKPPTGGVAAKMAQFTQKK